MIGPKIPCILTLALALLPDVAVGKGAPKGAPTYSNVCMHPESGDLLGLEISFVGGADGGYAVVQRYEGEATAPEVMKIKPRGDTLVLMHGNTESIAVQRNASGLHVTHLDGAQSSNGGATETLPPASAVWQGRPVAVCK
ncbi:hypothetical protein [Stenotrophomonas sp. ZAC14D2_NAIMI4_6]|uniref:hypothetical protein n=1 Tax=Stenotrophomonas sp. ZAC14D2_NAIMI4_6 TaxID=2072406 RepID=UPI000D53C7AD|nr:hypothetical protein [Stenotrophomonas sp. ZAC14D2_NAIMI4_6]AWH21252.1 hypothetical protein C1933_08485 [Stenotrophomonas sp. ZAC14D2_NAIMI4_6]